MRMNLTIFLELMRNRLETQNGGAAQSSFKNIRKIEMEYASFNKV